MLWSSEPLMKPSDLPDTRRLYRLTNRALAQIRDVVSAETVKGAFQRASKVPFDMPGQHLFAFREIMASGDGDVIRGLRF